MQLYKNFFKLINANRTTIIIYAVIMLIFAGSMMFAAPHVVDKNEVAATEKTVDYKNLGVLFRDNDNSELSRGVRAFVDSFASVEDDNSSSEESINDMLYFDVSDYFIEVPAGFQEAIENGEEANLIYSSHSQISGKTFSFVNDIDSFVNIYRSYRAMGLSAADSVAKAQETCSSEVKFGVVTEKKEVQHTDERSYATYMILLYFCYTGLCILCTGVGAVIISGNKREISQRIESAPVTPRARTWSQLAGLMTVAIVLIIIFVIFSFAYAGNSEMMSKYAWCVVLNLITTAFYLSGFTLMVANFNLNSSSLNLICNSLGLAMCFLCGIFVPFNILSPAVQTFSHFLPFFWSGKILNTIYAGSGMNYTYSVGSIFAALGVQVLFGLAFVMIAIVLRKAKQGKAA